MLQKSLILALALTAATVSPARDLYLSATGSDSGDGLTPTSAVATINKVIAMLKNGDVVHVSGIIAVDRAGYLSGKKDIVFEGTASDGLSDGFDGAGTSSLFTTSGGSATFRRLVFRNGYREGQGGAFNATGGTLVFDRCTFSNNKTACYGNQSGGAYYSSSSKTTFTSCDFYNNTAFRGGAIEAAGNAGYLDMAYCTVTDNQTSTSDGLFNGNASGGAISIQGIPTTTLRYCLITDNASMGHGGVFYITGNIETFLLQSSTVVRNMSGGRPGTFVYDGTNNEVLASGRRKAHAGVFMVNASNKENARYIISGTTIAANSCTQAGGVILMNGVQNANIQFNIVNSTITRNLTADNVGNCGGLQMSNNLFTLNIINSIVEGNKSDNGANWSDAALGRDNATKVNLVNSYLGYIYEYSAERGNIVPNENAVAPSTPFSRNPLLSGIDTQMDCEGLCFPLAAGAPSVTMGQPELVEQYGGEPFDCRGLPIGNMIGSLQLLATDAIPPFPSAVASIIADEQQQRGARKIFSRKGFLLPGSRSIVVESLQNGRQSLYTLDGKQVK